MSIILPNAFASGDGRVSGRPRRRPIRAVAGAAFAAVLSIATAGPGFAVECSNGGAGSNPSGNDGGVSTNTACGQAADASGTGSLNTAIGEEAKSYGAGGANTAVGYFSSALGTDSNNVAIGWSRSDGNSASNTAVGHGAQAHSDNGRNVAVGALARALGGHSIALGDSAGANYNPLTFDPNGFDNAIAIGADAFASTTASVAEGQKASVTGKFSVAVGARSTATKKQSVAIGYKSVANAVNTVSVGAKHRERRIVNVAKAKNPTDAVNLRQVKSLIKAAADASASSAAARSGGTALELDALRQEVQALRELVVLQKQRIDDLERGPIAVAHAM